MKFTAVFATALLVAGVSASPIRRGIDPALIPEFGHQAGLNPTGTGDCDGIPGGPKIPCSCPPTREVFIKYVQLEANVAAGHAINNPSIAVGPYPTGNSVEDQKARLTWSMITLQNLNGPGVGCPAASTTWLKQLNAL